MSVLMVVVQVVMLRMVVEALTSTRVVLCIAALTVFSYTPLMLHPGF